MNTSSISPQNREKLLFLGIAFAGLLLRGFYLFEYSHFGNFDLAIGADVGEYAARAGEIMKGQFFPRSPEIHAPLYSFFLAALQKCGAGVPAVRLIQTLLNFAAWIGLFFLMRRVGIPVKVRLYFLAGAMAAAPLIFHPAELISESLLLPIFTGVFFFLEEGKKRSEPQALLYFALAGLFAGLAFLTHGLAGAFIPVLLLFFLLRRQWKTAEAFFAGVLLAVLPFCAAKSSHYGRVCGVQENTGFNLFLGNNPRATGGCYLRPGNRWRKAHVQALEEAGKRGISTDRLWLERAADFWRKTPGKALLLWLKKVPMIFSGNDLIAGADGGFLFCRTDTINFLRIFTFPIFCMAFWGLWVLFRRREIPLWAPPLLLTLALLAAQIVTVTSGRYRLMIFPGVLFLAAAGCAGTDWKKVWLPALLFCAACCWFTYGFMALDKCEGTALLGEAAFRKGNYVYARDLLLYARHHFPDSSRIDNMLGNIAEKHGDPELARRCYADVVRKEPYMPEGWMNLACLTPDPVRAEGYFRKALECPGTEPSPALLFNYARLLYGTQRKAEAKKLLDQALAGSPGEPGVYNLSGIIAMDQGRFADAEKLFHRAALLKKDEAGYWRNTAVAARYSGNNALRLRAEERFLELRKKQPTVPKK